MRRSTGPERELLSRSRCRESPTNTHPYTKKTPPPPTKNQKRKKNTKKNKKEQGKNSVGRDSKEIGRGKSQGRGRRESIFTQNKWNVIP